MAGANQRIGEYVLDEKIGGGTFGEVWRAHHHVWTDQLVALKLPTDSRYVRNLQKQGVAVHDIVHPNVVRAIGCDPYADPPYLTMEYVPGNSLRPLISNRKLSIPEAMSVMGQVLNGLKCAHEKGLLHLDIKPENILIHERALRDGFGVSGLVKITDFGVGAAAANTAAESIVLSDSLRSADGKNLVGTLAYIAPEQRDGGTPDERADLYACGVVLYEMLTGERPAGTDLPSDLNPTVPKFVEDVFRRAYSRKDKRFASANKFLDALSAENGAAPKSEVPSLPEPPAKETAPSPSIAPPSAATQHPPLDPFCRHWSSASSPSVSPATQKPPVDPDKINTGPISEDASANIHIDPNLIAFDELNKKAIGNIDELKAALRHLYHHRQLSGEEIDRIRRRLTVWADSIPHHRIREFGHCIKISQAILAPYYWFTLKTQYESREIERREEPYRGAELPALATNEGNIRIWAYPFVLTEGFKPAHNEYRVEDSQEVHDCGPCKASGKVICRTCTGKGRVDCPTCDAAGHIPCPGCGGSGRIVKYRQEVRFRNKTEYRTITRYRDHVGGGHSWKEPYEAREPYTIQEQYTVDVPYQEPCPGCAGRGIVTCQTCHGSKEVRCETCIGTGQVKCQNCDGQGKVVSFLILHDLFRPAEDSRAHPHPDVRHDCSKLLSISNDYRVLLSISHPVFSSSIADSLAHGSLKGLMAEAVEASKAQCGPKKRIIKQMIEIKQANVIHVVYSHEKAEHDLCLCGSQLKVLAPRSPISKVTEGIFVRAVKLLDTEEINVGLSELTKTFDMHQRDEKANLVLSAVRAKLSEAYVIEATAFSREGLWPNSLYYSDRAKVLVPLSPSVAKHEAKIRPRVAFLHIGPPVVVALVAIILAALIEQPLLLISALAAICVAFGSYFGLGLKIRGTSHALLHSSLVSVALAAGIGIAICSDSPWMGLALAVVIVIVDVGLFKAMKTKLLRADPPEDLKSKPQEAIRQIADLLDQDWENIGPHYLALPSLSSYSGQMKGLGRKADEAEERRQGQADVVTEQYKARISKIGQDLVDGFNQLVNLIAGYTEALSHQNARKVQSLGPEIQQLGQTFSQQIAEFEKLRKSPPDSFEVQHDDGRRERVKLKIEIAPNASMACVGAIKPIVQCAANILKDPGKSLVGIAKHLPAVQAAMAQAQQNHKAEPVGAATAS